MVLAESVLTAKEGSATPDYASRLSCVFPEDALLANKVDETRDGSRSKRRVSYARQMVAVFACVFPQIPVAIFANKILFYMRSRQKLHASEGLRQHNRTSDEAMRRRRTTPN